MKKILFALSLLIVSCSSNDDNNEISDDSFITPLPNIIIGNQIWQSSNLDVTTYRDGTPIPQVTNQTEWANLTTGAWCYYNNSTSNGNTYGKLYNWYAVAGIHDNDPNTPNKILAPSGWRIPSYTDWNTLIDFLGGYTLAGGKMKSTGTSLWESPNASATNQSGFTALPGGYRQEMNSGNFSLVNKRSRFWSGTEIDAQYSRQITLFNSSSSVDRIETLNKKAGFSVRCVRNNN
jgi:uncharacterized protein (TIGR02145 family)